MSQRLPSSIDTVSNVSTVRERIHTNLYSLPDARSRLSVKRSSVDPPMEGYSPRILALDKGEFEEQLEMNVHILPFGRSLTESFLRLDEVAVAL